MRYQQRKGQRNKYNQEEAVTIKSFIRGYYYYYYFNIIIRQRPDVGVRKVQIGLTYKSQVSLFSDERFETV